MLGVGPTEFVIIALIALVLFGTPVITFLVGYSLGRRKLDEVRSDAGSGETDSADPASGRGHAPSTAEDLTPPASEEHVDE